MTFGRPRRCAGFSVALVVLFVASVLLDPYTFRQTASDNIVAAPAWQMAVGLADAMLLSLIGLLVVPPETVTTGIPSPAERGEHFQRCSAYPARAEVT
jgi:hypothetical protein